MDDVPTTHLLYQKEIPVNDFISVKIPTVGEVLDNEDAYYGLVSILTASPIDMMVQLDDIGIDFTSINDFELFLLLYKGLEAQDTSMVFGDLDLSKFQMAVNKQNGHIILLDEENDIRIDRAFHGKIAAILRKIHHIEKDRRKPANEAARKYLLERARIKMKRRQNKQEASQIESLIVALVNTEQYKYDFESTRGLSIFQFNECVRQIIKKIDYDNRMRGIYAGTISAKDMKPEDLNWLSHK